MFKIPQSHIGLARAHLFTVRLVLAILIEIEISLSPNKHTTNIATEIFLPHLVILNYDLSLINIKILDTHRLSSPDFVSLFLLFYVSNAENLVEIFKLIKFLEICF